MENIKIKWKNSGLLEGIEEKHQSNLIQLFEIAAELIDDKRVNEEIKTLIFPVIRRIYNLVVCDKNRFYVYKEDENLNDKIFKLINVEDIFNKLYITQIGLFNKVLEYYEFIDVQAEMTSLFCDNYSGYIINKYYRKE